MSADDLPIRTRTAVEDELDIRRAIALYAHGLDERRWEVWDEVFTDDALIDFRPMGGALETATEMSRRLGAPDPTWLFAQHPVTNVVVRLEGDTATARSDYSVETGRRTAVDGEIVRMSGGGTYVDSVIRTPAGWRIATRLVSMKWKTVRTVKDELPR